MTGPELIAHVTEAASKRGWAVFGFHGIAGDYAKTPQGSHDDLAKYLADNASSVWTATFGEVARYVARCR